MEYGFEDFLCFGWQCHDCKQIITIRDWNVTWEDNIPEICPNENCKHQRCEFCDSNDIYRPHENIGDSWTMRGLANDDSRVSGGEIGISSLEGTSGAMDSTPQQWDEHIRAEQDNWEDDASKAIMEIALKEEQYLAEAASPERGQKMMDDDTFDAIIRELMSIEPSLEEEAPETALVEARSTQAPNVQPREAPFKIPFSTTTKSPSPPHILLHFNTTNLLPLPLPPYTKINKKPYPCPLSLLSSSSPTSFPSRSPPLNCTRTFSHPRYAKTHAKTHTHFHLCPQPHCRSRFASALDLRAHVAKSHALEDAVEDLPREFFRKPLERVWVEDDEGADELGGDDGGVGGEEASKNGAQSCGETGIGTGTGIAKGTATSKFAHKYRCRFHDILACTKTFGQNGHANRHSLGHVRRDARVCRVQGCERRRFMTRRGLEGHLWRVHGVLL